MCFVSYPYNVEHVSGQGWRDARSTRSLQMDRKKTREECVGAFNLISTDTELESKVSQGRALPFNPYRLFAALIFIAYLQGPGYLFINMSY